jgi:hypothetical protein
MTTQVGCGTSSGKCGDGDPGDDPTDVELVADMGLMSRSSLRQIHHVGPNLYRLLGGLKWSAKHLDRNVKRRGDRHETRTPSDNSPSDKSRGVRCHCCRQLPGVQQRHPPRRCNSEHQWPVPPSGYTNCFELINANPGRTVEVSIVRSGKTLSKQVSLLQQRTVLPRIPFAASTDGPDHAPVVVPSVGATIASDPPFFTHRRAAMLDVCNAVAGKLGARYRGGGL